MWYVYEISNPNTRKAWCMQACQCGSHDMQNVYASVVPNICNISVGGNKYLGIYVCVCVCVYVCACVSMFVYVCVCVCMCVCVCVCMCGLTCTCVYACGLMCMSIHTYIHTHTHIHTLHRHCSHVLNIHIRHLLLNFVHKCAWRWLSRAHSSSIS